MSAHTPGPWEIVGSCLRTPVVANDRGGIDGGFAIAECSFHWGADESRANVRLIAAAPDMLDVLRAVAAHFADTDAPLGSAARAVIAKATQISNDGLPNTGSTHRE